MSTLSKFILRFSFEKVKDIDAFEMLKGKLFVIEIENIVTSKTLMLSLSKEEAINKEVKGTSM